MSKTTSAKLAKLVSCAIAALTTSLGTEGSSAAPAGSSSFAAGSAPVGEQQQEFVFSSEGGGGRAPALLDGLARQRRVPLQVLNLASYDDRLLSQSALHAIGSAGQFTSGAAAKARRLREDNLPSIAEDTQVFFGIFRDNR